MRRCSLSGFICCTFQLFLRFRHTDEMIQKLESAGLGYHVKADETTDRLGKINIFE